MGIEARHLILKICGDFTEDDNVSVLLLAEKLKAAQQLLFNVASAIAGGGRRGAYKSEVYEACTLRFVAARKGSLEITAKLPPPDRLFHEMDLGAKALDAMGSTLSSIRSRDRSNLENDFPDYSSRSRILKAAQLLIPEPDSQYTIQIETPHSEALLNPDHRRFVAGLEREEDEVQDEAVRTLTGKLYRIEVDSGDLHVGLIVENRHIKCSYGKEMEEGIRNLIPGSLVELEGRATLDERGQVRQIEEIYDYHAVQMFPLFWSKIRYENRLFIFNAPIQLIPDFRDGLWIHEYRPLGIIAYDETRASSLVAFRMEFAACYDFIAQEHDSKLSAGALEMKNHLRSLIKEVATSDGGA